ncbi:ankyrin repeat and SOCS box protein 1-like isoform X3 [Panulirus ornatus]|uniref:ankyrin repeat and SOCS box protein 1-like isoform X3 n=1 Tax=Panulirus ornatus TaxID=150431 RepID=UPI003A899DC7
MGWRRDGAKNTLKTVYLGSASASAPAGGNPECVKILLAAGANIELEDVKGQTPLFVATSQRKTEIMKILLEAGANPEGSQKNRCCPLLVAVRDGYSEGVKLLLQHGADSEPFDQISTCVPGWPLHHAVVYAHFTCFLELIKGGALANLTLLPYPVNPKILARLSIPHAILKYAKEHPEFVELYHECGGNLHQQNSAGATCLQEFLDSSPAKNSLMILSGLPLSLKSLCRVTLRQLLGRNKLVKLSSLDLPACLFPFLNFEEFSHHSSRFKENHHIRMHDK